MVIDYIPYINYAMMINEYKAFSKFEMLNNGIASMVEVKITLSGAMFETCSLNVVELRQGQTVSFDSANLLPVASKLMSFTESVQTTFTVTVEVCGQVILTESLPVRLMAFDQWHGSLIMPELIAAFVTPNHPLVPPICIKASRYLEEFSGSRDLDSYLTWDYQRIANQVESIYNALLDENITYAVRSACYEETGQRIRLIDQVLNTKLGNCIELSLLLCSCLEAIGIRTVLIIYPEHAIMGAWLEPMMSVPMVGYDAALLKDCIEEQQRTLFVIESTGLTHGNNFAEAVHQGEAYFLQRMADLDFFVDIRTARMNRIRPLPHTVQSETGWEIKELPDYDELFDQLSNQNPYDIHGTATGKKLKSKQLLWERKLLDLSLRNNLLNMRSGKSIVPLSSLPIAEIFALLDRECLLDAIDEKDHFATVKQLYRAARNSLEENGANTLFLSVGTLRWYQMDDAKPYFAPVLFIPIEIVRHGAKKYIVRARDEEPLVNITLLEMMRQTFELEIPPLMPVPTDRNDKVDYKRVFEILRTVIAEVNEKQKPHTQWEVVEECMVGIFSFTKFVMWNDIHTHSKVLENHPLLRSMMEGRLLLNPKDDADVRILDGNSLPAAYAIPVDVDSSQLEAVVESGRGKTFILYGPPGTGKSQTITNMIANALYQNKRVLFVSEKKAALDVVQERLKRIGLDPFCLELHSNKVDKKSFLEQMERAMDVPLQASAQTFQQTSKELFAYRKELNGYVEALHTKRLGGFSLHEYINRYLDLAGETMVLSYDDIRNRSLEDIRDLCDKFRSLDTVISILGCHPAEHPLLGLYPRQNTAENQRAVTDGLQTMPDMIAWAKKKETGWLNRWFLKKSALKIIGKRPEWDDFFAVTAVDEDVKRDLDRFAASIEIWNKHTDKLRLWYHYSLRAIELIAKDMPKATAYFLAGHSGNDTAVALLKGYYQGMVMNIIENDPELRGFNGMLFGEVIRRYRALTRQFQELTKQELVSRLSQRTPRMESADKQTAEELTFLRKRVAGRGRSYTVRRMLDSARHVLPQLCPCMLMSPLSVAQYLEMRQNQFDLVLFDEASQMPTSEAVGAIARGKTVVVVGDPKQMPPTSFFMAQSTNDDDVEIDDLESVLDDCISLGVPARYLSWHYRSKHESLIAFSNIHFYDGRLITFPSVDDRDNKVSLQYVDGYYDFGKSRQNKAEAKAIVGEVLSLLEHQLPDEQTGLSMQPQRSIGIVAFSKMQSTLIEDMLTDALAKHPELERLALKSEEPIFIKNLENVQGDERDIILFSVGYGPDKRGKVSMNFGPLNQIGGERRLNVAVSRARYEMKVFSTLHPEQIDLQRTTAKGVIALKRFLEYAEKGSLSCPASQIVKEDICCIGNQLADLLRTKGYEVHQNVGRSKFKVDVAIVDKENPSRYSLGIILDGKRFYDTPTARDREMVQPAVLSQLGWDTVHLWTLDWLANANHAVEQALQGNFSVDLPSHSHIPD